MNSFSSYMNEGGNVSPGSSPSRSDIKGGTPFSLSLLPSGMLLSLSRSYSYSGCTRSAYKLLESGAIRHAYFSCLTSRLSNATIFGVNGFVGEFATRLRDGKGQAWGEEGINILVDSVVMDGLRIYNSGRVDGASIVMDTNVSSGRKFLSIFFFSTPEQIDFIIERYDVYAFSDLLMAGSKVISKEWYGLLEDRVEQHLHDGGYILLAVFIIILKSDGKTKYLARAQRIFWRYMERFMGKFHETKRMSHDEIQVKYGRRTITLRSVLADAGGYLQYICNDEAAIRLDNIVLLLISRFAKGKWKDLIAGSIEAAGEEEEGEEANDILKGRDCRCRCECEMIKDILLPERFTDMCKKIDDTWRVAS